MGRGTAMNDSGPVTPVQLIPVEYHVEVTKKPDGTFVNAVKKPAAAPLGRGRGPFRHYVHERATTEPLCALEADRLIRRLRLQLDPRPPRNLPQLISEDEHSPTIRVKQWLIVRE